MSNWAPTGGSSASPAADRISRWTLSGRRARLRGDNFHTGESRMRKIHIGIAATAGAMLLSVAAVHAQGGLPPAPSTNPADVAAGTYTVDPNHSQVMFTYAHFGLTHN